MAYSQYGTTDLSGSSLPPISHILLLQAMQTAENASPFCLHPPIFWADSRFRCLKRQQSPGRNPGDIGGAKPVPFIRNIVQKLWGG